MTTKTQKTETKSTLKDNVKQTTIEGAEKLEKIAVQAKEQAIEVISEGKEKLETEVEHLNESVQIQILTFKQELLQRIEIIRSKFGSSQNDLGELNQFVKTELNSVLEQLINLGKELKEDVGQISIKHKDHLSEAFKRSKENTLDAWNKLSTK